MLKTILSFITIATIAGAVTYPEAFWETQNDKDIHYEYGNVGIGTYPGDRNINAKLEVSGTISTTSIIFSDGTSMSSAGSSYTNEDSQDAVGNILTDSSKITWTYDDTANTITATFASNNVSQFDNDAGYVTSSEVSGSDLFVEIAGDTMTGKLVTPELNATTSISTTTLHTDSHVSITGNLSVNGDTLKVDATGNKIGVGEGTPLKLIHLRGTGTSTTLGQLNTNLRFETRTGTVGGGNELSFMGSNAGGGGTESTLTYASIAAPVEGNAPATGARGYLSFNTKQNVTDTDLTERMRILGSGAISMNGTTTIGGLLTTASGISNTGTLLQNGDVTLNNSSVGLIDATGTVLRLRNTPAAGTTAAIQIDPMAGSSSSAQVRLFRNTNTSSALTGQTWELGDGNNTNVHSLYVKSGTTSVFNEQGNAMNFRTEGDNDQNLFYIDGTNDMVGVGSSTPSAKLMVSGTVSTSGLLTAASGISNTGNITLFSGDVQLATGKGIWSNAGGYRILEDEDAIDNTLRSKGTNSARLNLEATGNMQFYIDSDADQEDRNYVWFRDGDQAGGAGTQLMTLGETGTLRVITGDIVAGTTESSASSSSVLLGDYIGDEASTSGAANKICLFNCATTKNIGFGVSSGDLDIIGPDIEFYNSTTHVGGWTNSIFRQNAASSIFQSTANMFGSNNSAGSYVEIEAEAGTASNSYLTMSTRNSDTYTGIIFQRRRSGTTTDGTTGGAIIMPALEDSANAKIEVHVLSSMSAPPGGNEDVRFDSTGVMVLGSTNSKQAAVGAVYDPNATWHIKQSAMSASSGTCSFTNGSPTITTSANLTAFYSTGSAIRILNTTPNPDEFLYARVSSINSTTITMDENWAGTTGTGTCTRISGSASILRVEDADDGVMLDIWPTFTVFNESSLDSDFRIESDTDANAFFLDGGQNRIGMFTGAPSESVHISATTLIGMITFGQTSTAATNTAPASLFVESGSANFSMGGQDPADNDVLGRMNFYSTDSSAGARQASGYVLSRNTAGSAWNASSSTWDGNLEFGTLNDGTLATRMTITKDGNIGIGLTNPNNKLVVSGTVSASGLATFSSGISVTGNLTVTGLETSGLDVSTRISVTGNASVNGNVDVGRRGTSDASKIYFSNYFGNEADSGFANKLCLFSSGTDCTYGMGISSGDFDIIAPAAADYRWMNGTTNTMSILAGSTFDVNIASNFDGLLTATAGISNTGNMTVDGSVSISDSLDFTRIEMSKSHNVFEDFVPGNTSGYGTWDWSFSEREDGGTTPTASYSISSTLYAANRPGIMELTSGDDTDNQAVLYLGGVLGANLYIMGGGYFRYDTSIYIDQLATASEDFDLIIGLCSNIPLIATFTACTNGIYFRADRGSSANWQTYTCSLSGGCTSTTTSIAVAKDTWIKLTAIVNPAGNLVKFYINGTKTTTDHSADIPTAAGELSGPTFSIYKHAGSATRNFFIDYWSSGYKFTTER